MAVQLQRQREIVETLTRNGFGLLVGASGLAASGVGRRIVTAITPPGYRVDESLRSPVIVRRTLEELGPTFVKLGQILSTRADLVPPSYRAELAKLWTAVPAEPFAGVRATVEAELGRPLEEVFASFDRTPLGSASLGQTHAATLRDGRAIVVKVQRAGIRDVLRADLDILRAALGQVQRRWPPARQLDLTGFVDEFDLQLEGELDYLREGHNAERIAANFAHRRGLRVPAIDWEHTTARVLVMERLDGIPIDDVAALDAAGIDRVALGKRAATAVLDMILVDGFFHGDPHPGNLVVAPDGTINLLDYGMVGALSDDHRRALVALVGAFAARDAERMAEAVLDLAPPVGAVDRPALHRAVGRLIAEYADRPLAEVPMVTVLNELLDITRRHRLRPPPELSMVAKMLTMVDGVGRVLDPEFDMMGLLAPYGVKLLRQRLEPDAVLRTLWGAASEAVELGTELPAEARRILRHYRQEGVRFTIDDRSMQLLLHRLDVLGDRIVAGVLLAALIESIGRLGASEEGRLAKLRGPLLAMGAASAAALTTFLAQSLRRRD